MTSILLFLTGIVAGGFGSVLGLGGGIIIIPALTVVFGYPIQTAIGVSLIGVVATSTGASTVHVREGTTNVRLGLTLELATVIGVLLGALIAGWVNPRVLYVLFGLLMVYNAYTMYQKDRKEVREHAASRAESLDDAYVIRHKPLGLFFSMMAGVLSGLLGIGGGIIKVPLMYFLMGVPLKVATATSNFMVGITASAGALVYFFRGEIEQIVAVPVAVGVFIGALLGVRIMKKLPTRILQRVFIGVFLFIALQMVMKGIGG